MTASSGNQVFVGTRKGYVFPLTTAGLPAADSTTVYEGLELSLIKGFDIATPDARRISHNGNDRVGAVDFLPSLEAVTGEIRVAPSLMTLNAALMNVSSFSIGNIKAMPWQTEDQGSENDVSLLIFQQSLDRDTKLRSYRGLVIPRARVVPVLAGMNDNPGEIRYQVVANPSTKHVWGTSLITGTEGATEAAAIETMSAGRPKIVAWKTDGTVTDFLFPTAAQATSAGAVTCWLDGVLVSSGITVTTDKIAYGVAPTTGKWLVAFYEY